METSDHFLLQCPKYLNERSTFLNIIGSIDRNILTRSHSQVTETLYYSDSNSNNITNTLILNATMDSIRLHMNVCVIYMCVCICIYTYINIIYIHYIYIYIYIILYYILSPAYEMNICLVTLIFMLLGVNV